MANYNLTEGLELGDLTRLVKPTLSIDTFCSKMGEDKDIVTVAFTVMNKEPAEDLEGFLEKSYSWILDADLSSSEDDDGNYVVFVELERTPKAADYIFKMVEDVLNLTDQKLKDWTFTYFKDKKELPITLELLQKKIIKTPEKYEARTDKSESEDEDSKLAAKIKESAEMNSLRSMAGVTVQKVKVVNPDILAIQIQAGIR